MEKRNISFSPPDITEAEIQKVAEVLRSGWISTDDIEILGSRPYRLILL